MSILILAQVETSPGATARWGTVLLLGLSLACVVAWSGVLRRVASGQTLFAPVSQREVPWGLTDLLVIAADEPDQFYFHNILPIGGAGPFVDHFSPNSGIPDSYTRPIS